MQEILGINMIVFISIIALLVMSIAQWIFIIFLLMKNKEKNQKPMAQRLEQQAIQKQEQKGGVVFCRGCNNQFSSTEKICPMCGKER